MDAHGLQNPVTRIESGNSSNNSKNIENDIKVCQNAIETDPKDGQAYSDLGYIYYQLGKYDFAVLLYKKSIDLMASQADKAISWNRLGDAYRRLGDYGKALTAYQKSSESAPSKVPVVARARMSFIDNMVAG
jgi:tetratricopeptide (TPR) repeat protein